MTSNKSNSIVQIEAEQLKKLVTEVKETIVANINEHETVKPQSFCAADLWKVQKQMKPALRQKLTNRWGM